MSTDFLHFIPRSQIYDIVILAATVNVYILACDFLSCFGQEKEKRYEKTVTAEPQTPEVDEATRQRLRNRGRRSTFGPPSSTVTSHSLSRDVSPEQSRDGDQSSWDFDLFSDVDVKACSTPRHRRDDDDPPSSGGAVGGASSSSSAWRPSSFNFAQDY